MVVVLLPSCALAFVLEKLLIIFLKRGAKQYVFSSNSGFLKVVLM